jgi:HEAT repeat protein
MALTKQLHWAMLTLLVTLGCNTAEPLEEVADDQEIRDINELMELRERLEPVEETAIIPVGGFPSFERWGIRETAADALARIGPDAVPSLVEALTRNPNPEVRAQAAMALARMGPEAAAAVPELQQALYDPDETVRVSAARALGQIGPAAKQAIGDLLQAMSRPEPDDALPPDKSSFSPSASPTGDSTLEESVETIPIP